MTDDSKYSSDLKLCECKCGTKISSSRTDGKPKRFVIGHNSRGKKPKNWKDGLKIIAAQGYIKVRCVGHPKATKWGHYVFEHVLVMEAHLGRYLEDDEVVHHIDHNRQNNNLSNLQLMQRSIHSSYHNLGIKKYERNRQCFSCHSFTTRLNYPTSNSRHRNPYERWYHLPNDKVNWYCEICYHKIVRSKEYKIKCGFL